MQGVELGSLAVVSAKTFRFLSFVEVMIGFGMVDIETGAKAGQGGLNSRRPLLVFMEGCLFRFFGLEKAGHYW